MSHDEILCLATLFRFFCTTKQQTLAIVISKIRQSLDLSTIFTTTTQEVRRLLHADRVIIFRFKSDRQQGQIISEDIRIDYLSILGTPIPKHPLAKEIKANPTKEDYTVDDVDNAELEADYLKMLSDF